MLLLVDHEKTHKLVDVSESEYTRLLEILGRYSVEDAHNLMLLFKHTPYFILYTGQFDFKIKNMEEVVHESDTVGSMAYRMIQCKKMYLVYDCQIIMSGQELSMLITPISNVELGAMVDASLRKYLIDDILTTL